MSKEAVIKLFEPKADEILVQLKAVIKPITYESGFCQ